MRLALREQVFRVRMLFLTYWDQNTGQWLPCQPSGIPSPVLGIRFTTEPLVGTIDGVNRVFQLPRVPRIPDSVLVIKRGIAMQSGSDFVVAGPLVTFAVDQVPQPGDWLLACFE